MKKIATVLTGACIAFTTTVAQAQEAVPIAADKSGRRCGLVGIPQLALGEVEGRSARGAYFTVRSDRTPESELSLYFAHASVNSPEANLTQKLYAGEPRMRIAFPKGNASEFKGFKILIDGAPSGIETIGIINYLSNLYGNASIRDPDRIAFLRRLGAARTLTFVSHDAAGKELARDTFDVSGLGRALAALESSGFRCNYSAATRAGMLRTAAQAANELIARNAFEVVHPAGTVAVTALEAADCNGRLRLETGATVALPATRGSMRVIQNNGLAYIGLSEQPLVRLFAKGTQAEVLGPPSKQVDPITAMFGGTATPGRAKPSQRWVFDLHAQIGEIIEVCSL